MKTTFTSKDFKGPRNRRRAMARKMTAAMQLKCFEVSAYEESEKFNVIAHNKEHVREILLACPEEIKPKNISSISLMNPEQMKLIIITANEGMEMPEMSLYDVFKDYHGSGKVICSTCWND